MTALRVSNPEDEELAAATPFHAWWLCDLRSSLTPAERPLDSAPVGRRPQVLLCALGLACGAASMALVERHAPPAAQPATAARAPTGVVEIGEIRVIRPESAVAKHAVSPRTVTPAPPFNRKAAEKALSAAAASTSACRDGRQQGTGRVMITFAPSGRATSAMVAGGELGRSAVGLCIADRMQSAHVPPFSGEDVTLSKTIHFR
jgi:hypothetical protein